MGILDIKIFDVYCFDVFDYWVFEFDGLGGIWFLDGGMFKLICGVVICLVIILCFVDGEVLVFFVVLFFVYVFVYE